MNHRRKLPVPLQQSSSWHVYRIDAAFSFVLFAVHPFFACTTSKLLLVCGHLLAEEKNTYVETM